MTALPHNLEAEQALLGAVLINNDVFGLVARTLDEEHFFEPLHAKLFGLIGNEIAAGRRVTPATLNSALPNVDVAGLPLQKYTSRLCAEATTIFNAPDYAQIVRDEATKRAIIGVGEDLRQAANELASPAEALAAAWDRLDALRGALAATLVDRSSIMDLAAKLLDVEDAFVVPTHLVDLDRAIAGGLRSGRLVIIGGRPSMGKTVIACSVARRVAMQGVAVSFFSLETDGREIAARLAADELSRTMAPVAYRDIVAGHMDEETKDNVFRGSEAIAQLPIRVDASGGLSMAEIEARARIDRDRFARQNIRLGVVMIDYLGLIRHGDRYRGRKVDEIGEISWAAKTMAKRLDVCVMLLAQLNRSVEHRDDKVPGMSDLRDSGNVEQDADVIGLLYRPVYYVERSPEYRNSDQDAVAKYIEQKNRLDLVIGKNKLGPTPVLNLYCDVAYSCVDNAARY